MKRERQVGLRPGVFADTMIRDELIPRLRESFPDRRAVFGVPPGPVVVYPAEHPEVGGVEIFDDGGEITLVAGRFTHGHFSDHGSTSVEEAERRIVEEVVAFLEDLFADRVVLWGSHAGGGGWHGRGADPAWRVAGPVYVWSGPLAVHWAGLVRTPLDTACRATSAGIVPW